MLRTVTTIVAALLIAVGPSARAQSSRPHFDVASVKPNTVPHAGPLWNGACAGGIPQIEPRRFAATTTLYSLMSWAYGLDCYSSERQNLILTNAAWVRKDLFVIEAVIPEGSPAFTGQQLQDGEAPDLQKMIEHLLMDRFKVQVHRENRPIPVYALTTGKNGHRLKHYEKGSCDPAPLSGQRSTKGVDQKPPCDVLGSIELVAGGAGQRILTTNGATLDRFAQSLSLDLDRPVINQTGITGQFDFRLAYMFTSASVAQAATVNPTGPSIFTALQEQLGLRLEASKAPVDVFVIDHAEKPDAN